MNIGDVWNGRCRPWRFRGLCDAALELELNAALGSATLYATGSSPTVATAFNKTLELAERVGHHQLSPAPHFGACASGASAPRTTRRLSVRSSLPQVCQQLRRSGRHGCQATG